MILKFVLLILCIAIILAILDTLHRRKLRHRLKKDIEQRIKAEKIKRNMKELEIK